MSVVGAQEDFTPRFFFNVRSSKGVLVDKEGQTFRTPAKGQRGGPPAARDLIGEAIKAGRAVDRTRIFEVSNAPGEVVVTVPFADAIADKTN